LSKQLSQAVKNNPLGKNVNYQSQYNPDLLFAIDRLEKRNELNIGSKLPFIGEDIWNAYEISWLNENGLPQVAIGEFRFNIESENIVESKSLKLYLNSLNQSRFKSLMTVQSLITSDLSRVTNSRVSVHLLNLDEVDTFSRLKAKNIDKQTIQINEYHYRPEILKVSNKESTLVVQESLSSHLLKSNCLITNQPDWASIIIEYKGQKMCESALLKYIVSFRTHNEFHEQCVERIYMDIMNYCKPEKLTVYARYTRRGGLDINPWRSNHLSTMSNTRLSRQ